MSRIAPDPHFERFLKLFREITSEGRLVTITGAGISAESGLPTFRGPEGWWTAGSTRYTPQELATWEFFRHRPEVVWSWYLFRRTRARAALPNAAHRALVRLARRMGSRWTLVTQNVDGLHRRAGSPERSTYEIHGNLEFMRCARACRRTLVAVPDSLEIEERGTTLLPDQVARLHCDACGDWMRPHVLWFDEFYEEEFFRSESSLTAMEGADALLVVGSSGATTLPLLLLQRALQRSLPILAIDPHPTPFTQAAGEARTLHAAASRVLPRLVGDNGAGDP